MPLPELPQNKVGMMTRVIDVMKDGCAANFARVVDDDIAESEDSLRN
jgi:hypothetical protein